MPLGAEEAAATQVGHLKVESGPWRRGTGPTGRTSGVALRVQGVEEGFGIVSGGLW
jgi:hypothetical protein